MANEVAIIKAIKELAAEIHRQNKALKMIAEAVERKQFDDWVSPPIGTVYQNSKGCVMVSRYDFEKLVRNSDEEREDTDDRG